MTDHAPPVPRFGIVVPTVAHPDVLVPSLRRLVAHLPEAPTTISVCLNPVDGTRGTVPQVVRELEALSLELEGTPHDLIWSDEGGPIGFGGACNRGIENLVARAGGVPDLTVLFNDDLRVTSGWLEGLEKAAATRVVRLASEPPSVMEGTITTAPNGAQMGHRPDRDAQAYGRVGIVGPCSVNVAGLQNIVTGPDHPITEANAEHFAQLFRRDNAGEYLSASFLSGFCMALTRDCLEDLAYRDEGRITGVFKAETYPIAGYEDNDLCVRARDRGWRLLVDGETFIYHLGHQMFDRFFPEMQRGMRNRLAYYLDHRAETQREGQRVVAVYRCRMETGNDIGLWRASLVGMSRLVDGFAVLLTDNPLEAARSPDFQACLPSLSDIDRKWLEACRLEDGSPAPLHRIAEATRRWVIQTLRAHAKAHGGRELPVKVACWDGEFNERDERNRVIEMGEAMGADWLWSVDHDEIPEERASRRLVDRWLRHPDPMVSHWDFSWLNHWDSERQIRADRPWGDAVGGRPTYTGGMHGYRLWRVTPAAPARILAGTGNGLHCGNCPEAGVQAKRAAAFRFRHLGYLRHFDRVRKLRRYSLQDPNPDPWLVGGDGYGHLVQEEGATFYPYVQVNGIGLHMLVYEGEDPDDVGRLLDHLHGIVDRVVLVWTGAWDEQDRAWAADPEAPFSTPAEEWPETGPSLELAQYAALFGAEIIHHPLDQNIAEARNAGIRHLAQYREEGLGWALFLDPDEHLQNPLDDVVALRRMAEVSNGWGWLFRFQNLQPGGAQPTLSESVRMSRLDPAGEMVMNGRVHEGFDLAVEALVQRGEHPQLRYSPFAVLNIGQKISDEAMERKLAKYVQLLRLELEDNPWSAKAWVSLGLHAENEGDQEAAMQCYQRAMLCPGNSYLPFKEAALYHLRMARILVSEVAERTAGSHGYHRIAQAQLSWLREHAPDRPLLGAARSDPSSRRGLSFDLPPFPERRVSLVAEGVRVEPEEGGARLVIDGGEPASPAEDNPGE